ncbi:dihydrofolate reductase family protein [Kribbella sp. NBC_01505]|uniref:dihydrofolate reductase family protein n=1 Tax=Kribbella sp. NBC_01505 TaxID=2903580 RepID=UPI00386EC71A
MGLTTYYIFASLDGFVAAEDNGLDWLYELEPADRDFSEFLKGIGAFAMGSSSYESVLRDSGLLEHPERWLEGHRGRPAWVFSSRELPAIPGADITFVHGDVRPVHAAMVAAAGDKDVFIAGGGGLAARFAVAGLLDRMVVGVVPAVLTAGKALFPSVLTSADLRLENVERVGQVAYLTYAFTRSRG